jgi:hypothetical protein
MFELIVNSDLARTQVERQFSSGSGHSPDRAPRSRRRAVATGARRVLASAPSIVWAALTPRSH